MAELTKKLHFLKSGTEQTAKAYSTTTEVGSNYVNFKIDEVPCYAPLGTTTDGMATNGRVIKGSTTYAIKSQAKLPYQEVSYTTTGTHTFTVPAGITRIRVAVCGGGGGARRRTTDNNGGTVTSGGTSSLGSLISATGGGGATYEHEHVIYDHFSRDYYYPRAGTAGTPNGTKGNYSGSTKSISKVQGWSLGFSSVRGDYGSSGSISATYAAEMATGGSGGYNTGYFNVTSGDTYTVTVGSGGTNSTYTSNTTYVSPTSGFVLISYGGDI